MKLKEAEERIGVMFEHGARSLPEAEVGELRRMSDATLAEVRRINDNASWYPEKKAEVKREAAKVLKQGFNAWERKVGKGYTSKAESVRRQIDNSFQPGPDSGDIRAQIAQFDLQELEASGIISELNDSQYAALHHAGTQLVKDHEGRPRLKPMLPEGIRQREAERRRPELWQHVPALEGKRDGLVRFSRGVKRDLLKALGDPEADSVRAL